MDIIRNEFGKIKNRSIYKYSLHNDNNYSLEIITYGGIIVSFNMPDREDNIQNINLGFDNLDDYFKKSQFFGALIGRFANRINKGKFSINNMEYQLALNDNQMNHLHGGNIGYDKVIWEAEEFINNDEIGINLNYLSQDNEENYPGNVKINVKYIFNNKNELRIEYSAETDKATPFNMTQHSYWNLNGAGNDTVLDHELQLNCSRYLIVDEELIPTGEIGAVENTPFNFLNPKTIKQDIDKVQGGYDHCFILKENPVEDNLKFTARVKSTKSGRGMEIFTTKPAVQFYSGNFLNNINGPDNLVYKKHGAFCLEPEYYPDAVNHKNFPDCILKPGEKYKQTTLHKFFIE